MEVQATTLLHALLRHAQSIVNGALGKNGKKVAAFLAMAVFRKGIGRNCERRLLAASATIPKAPNLAVAIRWDALMIASGTFGAIGVRATMSVRVATNSAIV
jgi:hypothetical protein